jgi:hypothetical protein
VSERKDFFTTKDDNNEKELNLFLKGNDNDKDEEEGKKEE